MTDESAVDGRPVDNEHSDSVNMLHPLVAPVVSLVMLVLAVLASYLLGLVGVKGVIVGSILVVIVAAAAIKLAVDSARRIVLDSGFARLPGLQRRLETSAESSLASFSLQVRDIVGKLEELEAGLKATSLNPVSIAGVYTEQQYAALEASEDLRTVVIAIDEMGNEFEERLDDRDALIDFGAIVKSNLSLNVDYFYLTENTPLNRARARRAASKVGQYANNLHVVWLKQTEWQKLPFNVNTAFLVRKDSTVDGYMLIPISDDSKAERAWARLSEQRRDTWWGLAEELLPRAESVSLAQGVTSQPTSGPKEEPIGGARAGRPSVP